MKNYKVLWLDDECETLESIVELAAEADIELIGYTDAESGIRDLNSQAKRYDAVLLDGKFYRTVAERGARALGNSAFTKVALSLKELKAQGRVLPWFVLSGQPNFVLEAEDWIGEMTDPDFADGKIFDKSKDEDFDTLWQAIKDACDKLPDTKLRHHHQKVFEACGKYVPEAAGPLMKVLRAINVEQHEFDDAEQFNQLRIVLEFMFRAANRYGLLHDKCISAGVVNINQSSLFMSGKECKVLDIRCAKAHFTGEVSYIVRDIITLTNSGSHSADEGGEHLNVAAHRSTVGTPYLLFSLAYRLMDVLIWLKNYVDENPDLAANKRLWQNLEARPSGGSWLAGRITVIQSNGWGTFVSDNKAETLGIPKHMVEDKGLKEGMEVKVLAEPQSNGKTFIKDIRR